MSDYRQILATGIQNDAKIQFIRPQSLRDINDGQWGRLRAWLSDGNVNNLGLPNEFNQMFGLLKEHFAEIKPTIPVKLARLVARDSSSEQRSELVSGEVARA